MKFVLAITVVAYSLVFWYGFNHKTTRRTESASNQQAESIYATVGIVPARANPEGTAKPQWMGDYFVPGSFDSQSNDKQAQVVGAQMKGWLDSKIAENRRIVHVK